MLIQGTHLENGKSLYFVDCSYSNTSQSNIDVIVTPTCGKLMAVPDPSEFHRFGQDALDLDECRDGVLARLAPLPPVLDVRLHVRLRSRLARLLVRLLINHCVKTMTMTMTMTMKMTMTMTMTMTV